MMWGDDQGISIRKRANKRKNVPYENSFLNDDMLFFPIDDALVEMLRNRKFLRRRPNASSELILLFDSVKDTRG